MDPEGLDLPEVSAAREYATGMATRIAAKAREYDAERRWTVVVTDETGTVVLRVAVPAETEQK